MCHVPRIETTSLPFRFYRDECACLPQPVEYVEFRISDGNTYSLTIERARRNPAHWRAIAQAYAIWSKPLRLLTDQRKTRVRVPAGSLSIEPTHDFAGRI